MANKNSLHQTVGKKKNKQRSQSLGAINLDASLTSQRRTRSSTTVSDKTESQTQPSQDIKAKTSVSNDQNKGNRRASDNQQNNLSENQNSSVTTVGKRKRSNSEPNVLKGRNRKRDRKKDNQLGGNSDKVSKLPESAQVRKSDSDTRDVMDHPAALISRSARNAKGYADRLLDDSGKLSETFDANVSALLESINNNDLERNSAQTGHVKAMLERLQKDEQLRSQFNTLKAPAPNGPMVDTVRATLGLGNNEQVTAAHVRRAAMSALLTDLRQSDVGSCFGTSVAIRTQRLQPERFLKDIAELSKTGKLAWSQTSTPMNRMTRNKAILKSIQVDPDGKLVDSSGAEDNLYDLPGFAEALQALGINKDTLAQEVKTAIASIRKEYSPLSNVLETTPEKVIQDIVARKSGWVNGLKGYEDDRKNVEQANELSAQLRRKVLSREISKEPDKDVLEEDQKTIDKIEELLGDVDDTDLGDFAGDLPKRISRNKGPGKTKMKIRLAFYEDLARATGAFVDATENRLLRNWEYTITSIAEAKTGASKTARLVNTINDLMKEKFLNTGKLGNVTPSAFLSDVEKKLRERLKMVYDTDIASEGGDGQSSRGGWRLMDTNGLNKDPKNWTRIEDIKMFEVLISGLLMEVGRPKTGVDAREDRREQSEIIVKYIAEDKDNFMIPLIERLNTSEDSFEDDDIEDLNPETLNGVKILPWLTREGHNPSDLLAVYDGSEVSSKSVEISGRDLTGLAKMLIDIVQEDGQQAQNKQSGNGVKVMSMPGHTFLFRPDLGPLANLANVDANNFDSEVWLKEQLPPTDEQVSKLSRKKLTRSGVNRLEEKLIQLARLVLKDNVTEQTINSLQEELKTHFETVFKDKGTITDKDFETQLKKFAQKINENSINLPKGIARFLNYTVTGQGGGSKPISSFYGDEFREEVRNAVIPQHIKGVVQSTLSALKLPANLDESVLAELDATKPVRADTLKDSLKKALTSQKQIDEDDIISALLDVTEGMDPPVLPFADTNWGDSSTHQYFALRRNPKESAKLQLVKVDQDGRGAVPYRRNHNGNWQVYEPNGAGGNDADN